MKSLKLTQVLLITTLVVLTASTLYLYQGSFTHTYAQSSIPSDVSNSAWQLSLILILSIFGGIAIKESDL
jgi:hypothetical protein